jgi:pilus assembly protein Flp/PilA
MCVQSVVKSKNRIPPITGMRLARSNGLTCHVQTVKKFWLDECGQDLVEYALVAALISLGATASMSSLAGTMAAAFATLSNKLGLYFT